MCVGHQNSWWRGPGQKREAGLRVPFTLARCPSRGGHKQKMPETQVLSSACIRPFWGMEVLKEQVICYRKHSRSRAEWERNQVFWLQTQSSWPSPERTSPCFPELRAEAHAILFVPPDLPGPNASQTHQAPTPCQARPSCTTSLPWNFPLKRVVEMPDT